MTEPLVHVLVPYVGRVDYLQQCVTSVLRQHDPRWRLTVVEDGDQRTGAADWVRSLSDERVEHHTNPVRRGIAATFQHCLELAEAPYLVVLGCDDRLLPGYVAAVADVLRAAPDAALVQPGVEVIDGEGRRTRTLVDSTKRWLRPRGALTVLQGERAAASLMRGNWMYFPSLCWRTDVVRGLGFRPDLPTTLDLELICRLVLAGHRVAVAPEPPVFQYRRHAASASSVAASVQTRFAEEARLFHELATTFREAGWSRAARAARWHPTSRLHALSTLPGVLGTGDRARTVQALGHALGRSHEGQAG